MSDKITRRIIGVDEAELTALRARLAQADEETGNLRTVLREHHQWHLDCGEIGLQAHDGEWIAIDSAGEYSDSLMCQRTEKALQGLPPDEAGPMPRGGVSAWWWQVAVLERRARRKAESRAAQAEAREASLFDAIAHGDEQHKTWLKEAIRAHFAGERPPAPYGKGITETLRIENADLRAKLAAAEAREAVKTGLLQRGRQKLATYTAVYTGDKELRGLLADWDEAIKDADGPALRLLDAVEAARNYDNGTGTIMQICAALARLPAPLKEDKNDG